MNGKKLTIFLCFMATLFLLSSCGKMQRGETYIRPITIEEGTGEKTEQIFLEKAEQLFNHIAADGQGEEERHFFSVQLAGLTQGMEVRIYRLTDGQWQCLYTACKNYDLTHSSFQMAMMFDQIPKEIALLASYQEEAECYVPSDQEGLAGLGRFTAVLENRTDIHAGDEIPLVMQGFMEGDAMTTFTLEDFHDPEKLAARNYERLYAITIYFS